jgi:hypothetical protein
MVSSYSIGMSDVPPVGPEESLPEPADDLVEHSQAEVEPDLLEADSFDDLSDDWDAAEDDKEYVEANNSEVRIHVPRPLVWALASVLSAACIITSLVTFAYGSWSPGGDQPTNLSSCLNPLRATLTAAGVPQAAVQHLTVAAQPGIFDSDALPELVAARKLLEPLADRPEVAAALQVLNGITAARSQAGWIHCP